MKKIFAILTLLSATLLVYAGDKPTFPGGEAALDKYLQENTRYPEIAKENGVEGIVVVGFIVNSDGSLKNIKIQKFVDPDLEKEAMRVVSGMPAWIPAEINGSAVESSTTVEVPFLME